MRQIILAEIDSSLVFKALQKQGLLQPGTPVTITVTFFKCKACCLPLNRMILSELGHLHSSLRLPSALELT